MSQEWKPLEVKVMCHGLPPHLFGLLRFIRGEGEFAFFGSGIHTYPGRGEKEENIYSGCVELERRGLIRRHIDEPGYVCFMPIEK